MNILSIGALNFLKNRPDKNLYLTYSYILNKYNNIHIDTTYLNDKEIDIEENIKKFNNNNETIVFILTGPDITNQNNSLINYEKYTLLYDIEDPKIWKQKKFIDKYDINYIMYRWNCPEIEKLKNYYKNKKFYNFSLYRNQDIFNNLNCEKTIDVLFYGSIGNHYPLRNKIKTVLIHMKKTTNLNIKILEKQDNIYGKDLNKLINQSYLCVSTSGNYDALLGKYIEILFSNSMILGNIPTQEVDLFENKHANINKNDTYENIEKKILEYLKNKENIIQNTDYLRRKFINKFSFSKALDDFNNILYFLN